jgi:hypothetical protein
MLLIPVWIAALETQHPRPQLLIWFLGVVRRPAVLKGDPLEPNQPNYNEVSPQDLN